MTLLIVRFTFHCSWPCRDQHIPRVLGLATSLHRSRVSRLPPPPVPQARLPSLETNTSPARTHHRRRISRLTKNHLYQTSGVDSTTVRMLRTPRHEYGMAASTPISYATPRANPLGSSLNGSSTPGGSTALASSTQHSFDFLQHPLLADPEGLQSGLKFDDLFSHMASFKDKVNQFVDDGCAKVDRANERHVSLKDSHHAEVKQLDKAMETEKKSQHELWTAIAQEREEDAEAHRVQSEKERHMHSLSSQLSDIQGELDEMRRQFVLRREQKRRVAGKMKEMARLNVPERELLESRTGCRIDSPGGKWQIGARSHFSQGTDRQPTFHYSDDLISFTFTMLDVKNPAAEAFFVFALHKRKYTMPIVQPPLPERDIQHLLDDLNKTRNAFKHIKEMRRRLKDEVARGARASMTLAQATAALRDSNFP